MERIKKYFGEYDLTYKKVILMAITIGVIVGIINSIRLLDNTSFQDIAINYDWWFVFAIFIVVNSKSYLDAGIKCFIFFLISQPLIFLVEVPFDSNGFGVFIHYIHWFNITLLTFPGAMLAYFIKKKNYLSILVLSVALIYFGYVSVYYIKQCMSGFPHHILSAIMAIIMGLFLIYVLFENKKHKIICLLVLLLSFVVSSLVLDIYRKSDVEMIDLSEGNWNYTIDNQEVVDVKINDNVATFTSKKTGNAYVCFENENNELIECYVNVSGNEMYISIVTD